MAKTLMRLINRHSGLVQNRSEAHDIACSRRTSLQVIREVGAMFGQLRGLRLSRSVDGFPPVARDVDGISPAANSL